MSAICGNAGLQDYLKRRLAADADTNLAWPHNVYWEHQGATVTLTIDGYWEGYYNANGFIMTAVPSASSSAISFSLTGVATSEPETATLSDAAGIEYTVTMQVYNPNPQRR